MVSEPLPSEVVPTAYELKLLLHPSHHLFIGCATISLEVRRSRTVADAHTLTLHALHLALFPSSVYALQLSSSSSSSGTEASAHEAASSIACKSVEFCAAREAVVLTFAEPLPNTVGDTFCVTIYNYRGHIRHDDQPMEGVFQSSHDDAWFIATCLIPTAARTLLPCFDEQRWHTPFRLSVAAHRDYTVVANSPVSSTAEMEEEEVLDWLRPHAEASPILTETLPPSTPESLDLSLTIGVLSETQCGHDLPPCATKKKTIACDHRWRWTHFTRTPPLPPAILGFVVGKFCVLEQHTKGDVLCRVIFPQREESHLGWFSLDLLTKALHFFEAFFEMPLPLPKLDAVALDRSPSIGAENWGMITLARDLMLVSGSTSLESRQRITRLIGHEVCHHWLGNWASIAGWGDTWLTEGLCRYLEYAFVDAVYPGWGMWFGFVQTITDAALLEDEDPRQSVPLHAPADRPTDTSTAFASIIYAKGAALMRMLIEYISMPTFRDAARVALQRYANRSFTSEDFLECIERTMTMRPPPISVSHTPAMSSEVHVRRMHDIWALSRREGHPYLLFRRMEDGFHVAQYMVEQYPRNILAAFLRQQRQHDGNATINLLSAPAHASFEWEPSRTLTRPRTPYQLPLQVLLMYPSTSSPSSKTVYVDIHANEMHFNWITYEMAEGGMEPPPTYDEGPSSPITCRTDSTRGFGGFASSEMDLPPLACYFNHGGGAFVRCDYDVATWRRIFDAAVHLRAEDRLAITTNFSRLKYFFIGNFPGEAHHGDRCVLQLEWLRAATGLPRRAINSYLWDGLTRSLDELLHYAQSCCCMPLLAEFAIDLYAPLLQLGLISFTAQEKSVSFHTDTHLTGATVLRILGVLTVCGYAELVAEAMEIMSWALADVCARQPSSPSASRSQPILALSMSAKDLAQRGSTGAFSGGDAVSPKASPKNASSSRAAASPRGDSSSFVLAANDNNIGSSQRTFHGESGAYNGGDECQAASARTAMLYLVEMGEVAFWGQAAAITAHILGASTVDVQALMGLVFPVVVCATSELLEVVLPAFFALEDDRAFGFMADVLRQFSEVGESVVKVLLRNSRFLSSVLAQRGSISPTLFRQLVQAGRGLCADGTLIALMKAFITLHGARGAATSAATTSSVQHQARNTLRCVNHCEGEEECGHGGCVADAMDDAGALLTPEVARAFDVMDANCKWMDYCSVHWDQYLRGGEAHKRQWGTSKSFTTDGFLGHTSMADAPPSTDDSGVSI